MKTVNAISICTSGFKTTEEKYFLRIHTVASTSNESNDALVFAKKHNERTTTIKIIKKYIKISISSASVKGFHPSLRNQAHVFGIATAFVRYDHGVNAKRSIWTICWPKPLQRAPSNVKLWMCTDCLICLSLLIFLALRSFWFVNFIGCRAIFRHTTYCIVRQSEPVQDTSRQ